MFCSSPCLGFGARTTFYTCPTFWGQAINTLESIQQIIDTKYRRFVERGGRTKVPNDIFRKKLGPRYAVSRVCISGNGRYAATACDGEKIRVWSVESGDNIASLDIPFGKRLTQGEVERIRFSNDGESLIVLRADRCGMVWKFLHSKKAQLLRAPKDYHFSTSTRDLDEHDGIVAAYFGGYIVSWDTAEADPEPAIRQIDACPWAARINLRNRRILCWEIETGPSVITVLDYDSLEPIATHKLTSDSPVVSNLADDGSFVVASAHRGLEFFELVE